MIRISNSYLVNRIISLVILKTIITHIILELKKELK